MKVIINELEIGSNYLIAPIIDEKLLSSDTFTLRNAYSKNITFSIMNMNNEFKDTTLVGQTMKYYLNDNDYRTYIINSVDYDKGKIKIKANDYMTKLDSILYTSELEYPTTYLEILQEIATKCGFELAREDFDGYDKVLEEKANVSNINMRTALMQFGEAILQIPLFDKDNKLDFYWFSDTKINFNDNEIMNFKEENLLEPINKISVVIGNNVYSRGTGENEYIILNNIFVNSQDMILDDAYDLLYGFKYRPFSIGLIDGKGIELGDTLVYNEKEYLYAGGSINSSGRYSLQTLGKSLIKKQTTDLTNMTTIVNDLSYKVSQVDPDYILEQAQINATNYINSGFGGHVKLYPDRILIMDTDDVNTAIQVYQWNLNGLAYSRNGINGPYELAITSDGSIVADFITSGTMSVDRIQGLSNTLTGIKTQLELDNESITSIRTSVGGANLLRNSIGYDGENFWENAHTPYNDTNTMQISGQRSCWLLQEKNSKQVVEVKNGIYTLSFIYSKLIELSECKVIVNNKEVLLDTFGEIKEEEITFEVIDNKITIEIISDTNNSCYVLNTMLNVGDIAREFVINNMEIETDTVRLGKGMEIISSGSDIMLQALNDIIAFKKKSTGEIKTEFTSKGVKTENAEIGNGKISEVMFKKTERQTLISRLKVGGMF